jgi:hypothetical protein
VTALVEIPRHVARAALAGALYVPSMIGGARKRSLFRDVETYCEFVGYPRSGHSLVGALLNAHPDMVFAHELAALRYARLGFGRDQIYWLILRNARRAARGGRALGGYVYDVPGQWQGRVRTLRVIGDKEGYGATVRIAASPAYLRRLRRVVDARIRFIHVVRNPYDIVTTRARRVRRYAEDPESCIRDLFSLCGTVASFKESLSPGEIFEIRHESLLREPRRGLSELCAFLGVDPAEDWIRDCVGILYEKPNKSRFAGPVTWTPDLVELVRGQMSRFPFLRGYAFEE